MHNIIRIDKDYITDFTLEIHPIATPYNSYRQYFHNSLKYDLPLVYSYTLKEVLKIPTDHFYSVKQNIIADSINTDLYPIAVRYVTADSKYLIERPPFQIPVDFRFGTAHSGAEKVPTFNIWIPWTSTIIDLSVPDVSALSSTKIFFNDAPLYSIDDPVISCDLPNSYSNGSICFSNSLNDIHNVLDEDSVTSNDVSCIYNYVFNNYMMGGWNSDLSPVFLSYGHHQNFDTSDLSMLMEYISPSPERKEKIISTFAGTPYEKIAKRLLNSKVHFTNIRSAPKLYFRDLIIRSSFTLEETLQYVTDIKTLYSRKAAKSGNGYTRYGNVNLSSVLSSNKDNSRFVDNGVQAASSYILNSVLQNRDIRDAVEHPYITQTGHIIVPSSEYQNNWVQLLSHSLTSECITLLSDSILNNYISGSLQKNNNIIFRHEAFDPELSRSFGSFDFSEESPSEILFPYFNEMISNIDHSKIKESYAQKLADPEHTLSILKDLTA